MTMTQVPGLYTSGWLSRGPNGVIATTMFDAFATADQIAVDLVAQPASSTTKPPIEVSRLAGNRRVVNWKDWERIDEIERQRGKDKGKLREKMTDVQDMLDVLQ